MNVREFVEAAVAEIEAANDRACEILNHPRVACGWCGYRRCDAHDDLDGLLYQHTNSRGRSSLDGWSAASAGRRTV
jgi:hypothetical protein